MAAPGRAISCSCQEITGPMQGKFFKSDFYKFTLVGVANTAVGFFIIFFSMNILDLNPFLSNALGYGFGLIISYILNRIYTFNSNDRYFTSFMKFMLSFIIAYSLNIVTLYIFINVIYIEDNISQLFSIFTYTIAFYILSKHFVFQNRSK
ncbi:MAG: GtrA family protein [Pseudomonadota bacterium]